MKECSLRDGSSMIWSLCACVGGRRGDLGCVCHLPFKILSAFTVKGWSHKKVIIKVN